MEGEQMTSWLSLGVVREMTARVGSDRLTGTADPLAITAAAGLRVGEAMEQCQPLPTFPTIPTPPKK